MTPDDYCKRCLAHVRDNLRELISVKHHLPRGIVERVHGFQLQLLLLRPRIFEQRAAERRIADGHGDLRPEHICLADQVSIFDCIEFSPDIRSIDVADELAFLAAECDFLGADWVGPRLFEAYRERTGDRPSPMLVDFYKSYRACVRAKVAALRADQLHGDEQSKVAAEASRHLQFADRYASPWLHPLVLVVGGLSGTGKTTLARALAEALGAELLRTDVIRQELFSAPAAAAIDDQVYSPVQRQRVYDELFRRAAALHADRISVVLDGTFSTAELVRRSQSLATDPASIFLAIECVCPPAIAHERISRRLAAGRDASAARPEIHDLQRQRWEPWPREIPQICVDTMSPLPVQLQLVIDELSKMPTPDPSLLTPHS
jgi:predicted kinase